MAEAFPVVFALFPRITQLDFTGPLEVLSRLPAADVVLASARGGELAADGGLRLAGLRPRAACHWAFRDLLPLFGAIPAAGRVVRDGNVITGGGVTAGIDMALTVVAEIAGADYAQSVQLGIEYAPAPPFNSGRPELAPVHVLDQTR